MSVAIDRPQLPDAGPLAAYLPDGLGDFGDAQKAIPRIAKNRR